jgi:hypothetical protein
MDSGEHIVPTPIDMHLPDIKWIYNGFEKAGHAGYAAC